MMSEIAENIAIVSCLACVWISGETALRFLKETPRLFTVMALFAFNWALVALYWSSNNKDFRTSIGVFTSFLLVYIGGLLAAYAREKQAHSKSVIHRFQILSIQLLFVVVLGKTISPALFEYLSRKFDFFVTHEDVSAGVEVLLSAFGFLAILIGIRPKASLLPFACLALILIVYAGAEIGYYTQDRDILHRLERSGPILAMLPWLRLLLENNPPIASYAYAFAALKFLFTLLFSAMVIGMRDVTKPNAFEVVSLPAPSA